jgi:hypothetical protein
MPSIDENFNQKENLAFIITDGFHTTSFLKEGNYFFISSGNMIGITPANLVNSIRVEKNIATFHFFSKEVQPCEINLFDDMDCMIKEYIRNFQAVVEEQNKKTGNLFHFPEGIISFNFPTFDFPVITRINIGPFISKTLKNRIINVSPTCQKSCELIIPENLKLSALDSKCYTKVGGIGKSRWFGTRIPIAEFEVSDSGSQGFRNIVKKSILKLPHL